MVALRQFQQGLTEYILEFGARTLRLRERFTAYFIESAWCVPARLLLFCGGKAFAFVCRNMNGEGLWIAIPISECIY